MKTSVKVILTVVMFGLMSGSYVFSQNGDDKEVSAVTGPKYGADSANCVIHLSLYREFYRQKNFVEAFPHWRWVFNSCPLSSQNLYIDGAKMVAAKIDESKDPAIRTKYIDTLMMVYDKRIASFNREGYVLGRKGIDLVTYRPENVEDNFTVLKKAVELGGNDTEPVTVAYYFQTILGMVQLEKLEKSAIIDGYDQLSQIIDHNMVKSAENPKVLASWSGIKANIELAFEPFATCEDLVSMYSKKFEQTPEDLELLTKITSMLERKECTNTPLFFSATENLHRLQPSQKSAYLMAALSREKKDLSKAVEYLNQAVELADNNEDKIKAYNLLASINFEQRNYPQARSNALKILQLNPSFGKAYIFIGDLYASSASMCTEDDLSGKTVFWAAIDMYQKAKSVDPSVAEEANNKIGQYARYYPAAQDLFFRDMQEGSSYKVGCWINESTTIRGIK